MSEGTCHTARSPCLPALTRVGWLPATATFIAMLLVCTLRVSCDPPVHHRASLASASWSAARAELEAARGAAVQHYWGAISSNSGKLVAASSEVRRVGRSDAR